MKRCNHIPLIVLLATFFITPTLKAETWSIGAMADRHSGVSIQYKLTSREAVHITSQFIERDFITFEGDVQKFHYPYWFGFYELGLYTGFGVHGTAAREANITEDYELVLPVGMQWNWQKFPMEVFAEVAGLMGPLPNTATGGRFRTGLRAVF